MAPGPGFRTPVPNSRRRPGSQASPAAPPPALGLSLARGGARDRVAGPLRPGSEWRNRIINMQGKRRFKHHLESRQRTTRQGAGHAAPQRQPARRLPGYLYHKTPEMRSRRPLLRPVPLLSAVRALAARPAHPSPPSAFVSAPPRTAPSRRPPRPSSPRKGSERARLEKETRRHWREVWPSHGPAQRRRGP